MDCFRGRSLKGKLSASIVMLAVVVQLAVVARDIVLPDFKQLWLMRGRSTYDRSVVLFLDETALSYLEFANSKIPEDAVLVIPKQTYEPIFGHVGMMQFYLFPRTIVDCPIEAAQECLGTGRPNTYILAPSIDFPPREFLSEGMRFVEHDGDRGFFAPVP